MKTLQGTVITTRESTLPRIGQESFEGTFRETQLCYVRIVQPQRQSRTIQLISQFTIIQASHELRCFGACQQEYDDRRHDDNQQHQNCGDHSGHAISSPKQPFKPRMHRPKHDDTHDRQKERQEQSGSHFKEQNTKGPSDQDQNREREQFSHFSRPFFWNPGMLRC